MFDPSDHIHTDPFARYQAGLRTSDDRAARAHANGQTMAQIQQRIQQEAAKRAASMRSDPPYKPTFDWMSYR